MVDYNKMSYDEFYKERCKMKAAMDYYYNTNKLNVSIKLEERSIIKKIILNGPATIFFWKDGSKTVVKCMEGDKYDLYTAFCIAFTKKLIGSNSKIKSTLKKAEIVDQNPEMTTEEIENEIAKIIDRVNKNLNGKINSIKILN